MKEVVKLGQLLGSAEQRDAVHVAVIPCVTAYELDPGDHVGITKEKDDINWKAVPPESLNPAVGIVDPFLTHSVGPKHRFYVMLYPNTIESLRHEWRHKLIDKGVSRGGFLPSADARAESRRWLKQFAEMYSTDYDKMIHEAEYGGEVYFGDDDGPQRARSTEFWKHIENVTGKLYDSEHRDGTSFRCGC